MEYLLNLFLKRMKYQHDLIKQAKLFYNNINSKLSMFKKNKPIKAYFSNILTISFSNCSGSYSSC